jgi:hypothetical protein
MVSFAEIDQENEGKYLKLLSNISKLSGLFSESSTPFINYRVAENIFCRSFSAKNLSRSDTAFDAKYGDIGVGLKTFNCINENSTEKIAEFNQKSELLRKFKGRRLALKLAELRNERIDLAKRTYNINDAIYHIVARKKNKLILYETDYDKIDINNIHSVKGKPASLNFFDGCNYYSYNHSKSTLFRQFRIPDTFYELEIGILEDPYSLLLELFEEYAFTPSTDKLIRGVNYVVLPLYGSGRKVYPKSGLNQWNACGRERNNGEVYIPVPKMIHDFFPEFFPSRHQTFNLRVPTNEVYTAKLCQENRKALMTNPNRALSNWLLRKVLHLKQEELATIKKLDTLGFDSVILIKKSDEEFHIDIMKTGSYEQFMFE